jgi:hypothetical protein
MAVIAYVNGNKKKDWKSSKNKHCEETIFDTPLYVKEGGDDMIIEMNAWPCTKEGKDAIKHNCHGLLKEASKNRTITVIVTADQGGYAVCHGFGEGATGTIVYSKGKTTSGSTADEAAADSANKSKETAAKAQARIDNKGKGPKRR